MLLICCSKSSSNVQKNANELIAGPGCSKSSFNVQKNANELIAGPASRRKEEDWTEVNEDLAEEVKSNNWKWVKGRHTEFTRNEQDGAFRAIT